MSSSEPTMPSTTATTTTSVSSSNNNNSMSLEFAGLPPMESGWDKTKRRFMEEPLVPLGCILTAGVLVGGLRSFARAADQRTQQRFMRARVVAQGATVLVAALGGILAMKDDKKL